MDYSYEINKAYNVLHRINKNDFDSVYTYDKLRTIVGFAINALKYINSGKDNEDEGYLDAANDYYKKAKQEINRANDKLIYVDYCDTNTTAYEQTYDLLYNTEKEIDDCLENVLDGDNKFIIRSGKKYWGSLHNGKYSGYGVLENTDNKSVYKGYFDYGQRQGNGTITWNDGSSYSGDWYRDKMHGEGTYTWKSGQKYIGSWKENNMHGYGEMYYTNGDIYKGNFCEDCKNGKGTMYYNDGSRLTGFWSNGDLDTSFNSTREK